MRDLLQLVHEASLTLLPWSLRLPWPAAITSCVLTLTSAVLGRERSA